MSTINRYTNYPEQYRLDSNGNLEIGTTKSVFSINQRGEINLNDSLGEMLKITSEGFYVRGVKVEQDIDEAKRVYEAFRSWLVWTTFARNSGNYEY